MLSHHRLLRLRSEWLSNGTRIKCCNEESLKNQQRKSLSATLAQATTLIQQKSHIRWVDLDYLKRPLPGTGVDQVRLELAGPHSRSQINPCPSFLECQSSLASGVASFLVWVVESEWIQQELRFLIK